MTVRCTDRPQARDCGACVRRSGCEHLFANIFGKASDGTVGRSSRGERLFAFLGGLARLAEGAARQSDSLRGRVERLVESSISGGTLTIDQIALQLGCSRQTLYRRLKAEGVSFAGLVERVRQRSAKRMLADGASVKEVAYSLGYSDPAAFSRAFKRWTGRAPREAR